RDVELLYAFQQIDQRHQVVLEIHKRMLDRFSYGLICREMNDARNVLVLFEDGKRIVVIAKVNFIILDLLAGDLFHPFEYPGEDRTLLSTQMTSNPLSARSAMV